MAREMLATHSKIRQHRYVISSCSYTWWGYEKLLDNNEIACSRIMVDHDDARGADLHDFNNEIGTLSVFLKGDLCAILDTLKKCVSFLNAVPEKIPVIIYGRLPMNWLFNMMKASLIDKRTLGNIRVASLPRGWQDIVGQNNLLLKEAAQIEERLTGCATKGLTLRELDIVLDFYRGMSVKEQSEKLGLGIKTVYTHRQEGLRKLQFIQPWINDSGVIRNRFKMPRETLSALPLSEPDFYLAIERKEIFPVYQIITDRDKKGIGFEILLRWYRNGKLLSPASFLTGMHNKNIWLKLTAMVVDAAVRGVNKYNGKYYFSVNIPQELASGAALPGMARKAVQMLSHACWAQKLVFEFAETIDVTQDKTIPETMRQLRETGCRLFLDDCFSSEHVMFPVRQIMFDGLKLDRDIVDKFAENQADYSLIKAIQYYSDMTGRICIAEGVDSKEKFEKLTAAGVNSFQGYYLSRAVRENELDRMVRQFS
ncbi:EAL domain-containing protein [Lelliottia sp. WAP21]|uniref:EAL domain-containing protein n=1 Tax=Lelliottia sp. WAP21 TaxID=2877426 RepID=UPI001E65397C|nr:EAL domain-containing protein [Lelliottia sp. WAP21]